MNNEEEILRLTAQLRHAQEQYKLREKAATKAQAEKKEAAQARWRIRRQILMEIEEYGGWRQVTKYKSFKAFCQGEMQEISGSVYAEALTYGYFEKIIFEVPICTYAPEFFLSSGLRRGQASFPIRKSKGTGNWEFDRNECDRAKRAWKIAKEIAVTSHPKDPLPNANDMAEAIEEITGCKRKTPRSGYQKAVLIIKAQEKELEELRKKLKDASNGFNTNIFSLADYKASLREVDRLIEMHCNNPAEKSMARGILIQESPEEAKRYIQSLIARRYARRAA